MNEILRNLSALGCDIPRTVHRFADDENFYLDSLRSFVSDAEILTVNSLVLSGDFGGAFAAAHDLKGVTATLGLEFLREDIFTLVEALRPWADTPEPESKETDPREDAQTDVAIRASITKPLARLDTKYKKLMKIFDGAAAK